MVDTRSKKVGKSGLNAWTEQANEQKKGHEFKQIFMKIVYVIHLKVNLMRFMLLI